MDIFEIFDDPDNDDFTLTASSRSPYVRLVAITDDKKLLVDVIRKPKSEFIIALKADDGDGGESTHNLTVYPPAKVLADTDYTISELPTNGFAPVPVQERWEVKHTATFKLRDVDGAGTNDNNLDFDFIDDAIAAAKKTNAVGKGYASLADDTITNPADIDTRLVGATGGPMALPVPTAAAGTAGTLFVTRRPETGHRHRQWCTATGIYYKGERGRER